MSYGYEPIGAKHSIRERLFFSPVRCTAILLTVALSLTSIGFIMVQRPWQSTVLPNIFSPPVTNMFGPPVPEVVSANVYDPFVAPSPSEAIVDPTVRPIEAHCALSDECVDMWVSTGQWQEPCRHSMVQDANIDLVYVWVNGSDPLHRQARQELLAKTHYKTKDARFREHDELRYSLRAARNATASWPNSTWHVITADVPDPDETDDNRRLGLVPQWLDIECAFYGSPEGQPSIRLQHDTELFRLTGRPGATLKATDSSTWLQKVIPSFNSHAIESQLPQLDPDIVSENIVALNDDQFFMLPLPPSAFHTTMYGQVFRMQWDLLVGGDSTGRADGGGEWRSLGWSSYLLNERFGERKRPYMHHNARALSLPLMHETSLAFGSYFAATPLSQFRGSHKVAEEFEVNTIFLTTHYVIERHREALLWSWVVAKWGGASGVIDSAQKDQMWRELGGSNSESRRDNETLTMLAPERTTGDNVETNLLMGGVQPPYSSDPDRQADTTYSWVSMDGYSASFHQFAAKATINRAECLGREAEPAWAVFRRLLKDSPSCGDNVIASLIHASKSGLSVFLPLPPPEPTPPSPSDPIILPLELPLEAPPLPQNPRAFAVRLLLRYAYVLGDSPTLFLGLKSATQGERALVGADKKKNTALLCLNDDLRDGDQTAMNGVLRRWFERRWPEKLQCEL
ncbi:hypothetical protein DFH07DRAFT_846063 [Mycena maculata]|uniref:Stealth protein CR1 conserved region 1 domain-containing protein n=1 Tax=Mycena maculata TaxID=230809 RepID=A0AAD7I1S3_9AGAR|nr:hypothetical protein DFH07DRAFT_846063 [Mycena maculata]